MAYLTASERLRVERARHPERIAHPFLRPQLIFVVLAIIGLGIATYLSATHLLEKSIECGGAGECDYVNASDYAHIAGVPVALLGLALYGTLLAIAVQWYRAPESELWPVVYWGVVLSGAGYAGYLTYVELEVLHAICLWCVASAIVLLMSLALSTAMLLRPAARSMAVPTNQDRRRSER
jgi:uncharacterized membrane protein